MTPIRITVLLAFLVWLTPGIASAQICTREYMPVCGQVQGQAAPQTFGNRCMLMAANARLVSQGECPAQATPATGSDVDAHGCIPSAGYLWNKELGSCVRPWLSSAITLEVAPRRQRCQGETTTTCLRVRQLQPSRGPWQPLFGEIAGFEAKPGIRYRLRVRKDRIDNPPADAPDTSYTLLRVLR